MIIATTVAGLGTPTVDGVMGAVKVGSGADLHHEVLIWNLAQGAWVGRQRHSMRQIDSPWGMVGDGSPGLWAYPSQSEGAGNIDTGFGFQIHPVNYADVLCAAGLKLQEHLSAITKPTNGGPAGKLALNWYSMNVGDQFLSPVPTNFGVVLITEPDTNGQAWKFVDSGWQNTPAAVASKKSYYPELYQHDDSFSFKDFTARHRWVGGVIGALGGGDDTDHRPPVIAGLQSWHVADTIPRADGATVPDWQDASGYSRHLQQSNPVKQPLLVKGALNGHAVVRFDGINDLLQTIAAAGTISQPATILVVLKQYAGGPAQQVWIEGQAGPTPLLYRADGTDQVDYWLGAGGDAVYHRGSPWPSPFVCFSLVANGGASNLWENKTLKITANAGSILGAGLSLGAAWDGSLPAQIDVAEVLMYYRVLSDAERNSVVDYLNAKYGLF